MSIDSFAKPPTSRAVTYEKIKKKKKKLLVMHNHSCGSICISCPSKTEDPRRRG